MVGQGNQTQEEHHCRTPKTEAKDAWKRPVYKSKIDEEERLKNGYVGIVHNTKDIRGIQDKFMEDRI